MHLNLTVIEASANNGIGELATKDAEKREPYLIQALCGLLELAFMNPNRAARRPPATDS
jgi:hypothetical protein